MVRWIPFILIFLSAIALSGYFFYTGRTSTYLPATNNPKAIYIEACAECHGKNGEGAGLFFPGLLDSTLSGREIVQAIREGGFMMPAFAGIPDSSLKELVQFIRNKDFRNTD